MVQIKLSMRAIALIVVDGFTLLDYVQDKQAAKKFDTLPKLTMLNTDRNSSLDLANDSDAISSLAKMGAYLRSLKNFEVTAVTQADKELKNVLKSQYAGTQVTYVSVNPPK